MKAEDGIQGTVDHLHRTIYGALVEGKTFKWMHTRGIIKVDELFFWGGDR
jgi:hypothetical protein